MMPDVILLHKPLRHRVAAVYSRALQPLPVAVLATVVSAVAAPDSTWRSVAGVVALFGLPAVAAIALMRALGGPGWISRRRAVPVILAVEVAALVVGALTGAAASTVVRGFLAYVVAGLVVLAGDRRNLSAHGTMAGTLAGLVLVWAPLAVGIAAVLVLAGLVWSRVELRQHTPAQAIAGAAIGCAIGWAAATIGA